MIALAFEHHLVLANNIPLDEAIKWLMNIAPKGLIEFVDKKDETVKKMLSLNIKQDDQGMWLRFMLIHQRLKEF